MFNFYVDLAGQDIVTETVRATTHWRKFKTPSLQTKSTKTKTEGPFENMSFSKKPFEDFNEKKKTKVSLDQTTPWSTSPQTQQLNLALVNSNN